jgi:hypothetical protein
VTNKGPYYPRSAPFLGDGKKRFVAVEGSRQTLRRRMWGSEAIIDEIV